MEIIEAGGHLNSLFSSIQRRQEHPGQNGDDRDYDQKLNERKGA